MATKLININKSGQVAKSLKLDGSIDLVQLRKILENEQVMEASDRFLNDGAEVEPDQETSITLDELLGESGKSIMIGAGAAVNPIGADDGVQHYNQLSGAQKMSLFSNINLFRGITLDATGFKKTFETVYSWKNQTLPAALRPAVASEVCYTYSFSKVTQTMMENSVDKGSVSLDAPFGDASAEFSYEKTRNSSSEKLSQYITGKYLVRKVAADVDPDNLVVDPGFEKAVSNAISSDKDGFQQYYELLKVLNRYGYYLPLKFTLGGALFSSDTTSISEFSEAETHKQEFGGSFKAKFEGIGGGGSYSSAKGGGQSTATSTKFQITSFSQIGGRDGTTDSYADWAKSLDKAIYWDVVSYDQLYPTIGLLSDGALQGDCLSLMDKFSTYPNAVQLQPYLNMSKYATAVQSLTKLPW